MSQHKSIRLAIELATRQRDEAARAVAHMNRNLGFARDQMAQLDGYAADTDARLIGARDGVLSAELIRHHYQFMDRLQQAISLQSGVIEDALEKVGQAAKVLLQAEFRLAGLSHVLDARQESLSKSRKRREQRITDEFAGMAYFRKSRNAEHGGSI